MSFYSYIVFNFVYSIEYETFWLTLTLFLTNNYNRGPRGWPKSSSQPICNTNLTFRVDNSEVWGRGTGGDKEKKKTIFF